MQSNVFKFTYLLESDMKAFKYEILRTLYQTSGHAQAYRALISTTAPSCYYSMEEIHQFLCFSEPPPKDHMKENWRRMRQIQKVSKDRESEKEKKQPLPVKALWKSEKYNDVPSRITEALGVGIIIWSPCFVCMMELIKETLYYPNNVDVMDK
jgi:hypothetical protein